MSAKNRADASALVLLKLLTGFTLVASGAAATADCSRPISVPAAPTGFSVITSGDQVSPALISLKTRQLGITSVKQLVENRALRGALVRSFSYGDEYQALLLELDKDKRIDYVTDLNIVARMLAAGRVDFTIVAPTLMFSSLGENAMTVDLNDKLQYTSLEGLKRIDSGAYLSRTSLDPADQDALRKLFTDAVKNNLLWNTFLKYYPTDVLRGVVTRTMP